VQNNHIGQNQSTQAQPSIILFDNSFGENFFIRCEGIFAGILDLAVSCRDLAQNE
jgi:hypothetical protein